MDNTPMTFTSLALIVLLVIMSIIFACHCLGPRAATWLRSNKEEKIGLSKNKLFHANGYMVSALGTTGEFLLSTNGSFKRFDTIDKDDHKSGDQQPHQTTTTPLWNLPQADVNIPPQPLRPAPAPCNSAGPNKTVTFSFNQINEVDSSTKSTHAFELLKQQQQQQKQQQLRSCLRSPHKVATLPKPLQAPPVPRLTSSSSVTLSASAIPRPIAKRQISLQNCIHREQMIVMCTETMPIERRAPTLTLLNSSTNPFLCESFESLGNTTINKDVNNSNTALNINERKCSNSNIIETNTAGLTYGNNPFYAPQTIEPTANALTSGQAVVRKRSLSETELGLTESTMQQSEQIDVRNNLNSHIQTTSNLLKINTNVTNPFTGLTQRVKGPHMLQKTISEDFLFRKLGINGKVNSAPNNAQNGNGTWCFGRALLRGDSTNSLNSCRNNSQMSLDSASIGSMDGINLERAISCDSVNSDCSVFQYELDQPYAQITGYLYIGLNYNKNSITNEGMELTVSVLKAKGLICSFNFEQLDTFVRIYLVPDHAGAVQTKVFKASAMPSYNESFTFWLKKQQGRHSFWFHLYHNGPVHTLIGEAEMEIDEMPRPITTWLTLSDSRQCNARWGELMFSLSYLPTAERLTIVVVKARNLKLNIKDTTENTNLSVGCRRTSSISTSSGINHIVVDQTVQNVFVKVYLMNNDKKVLKKRTSLKRNDRYPIFNESMIFSVPPHSLTTVQLRLTVFGVLNNGIVPLGHVIVGSCAVGKGLRHWHQMLSSLRKPVAMWHVLRRATNQPIFTGGAEAVVAAMQSTAAMQRTKRNSII